MTWCLGHLFIYFILFFENDGHLVRLLLHNHETVANTMDRPPFPTK